MTMSTIAKVDKAAFFHFVEANSEGRYEFVRGRIEQQMTGGTLVHVQISKRFVRLLEKHFPEETWMVSGGDRGVDTPVTIRYPDVVVEPAGADPKSLATAVPAVIVEILSPDSKARDLREKPVEYLSLPSLQAYIVASQDEARCQIWVRDAAGVFPATPIEVRGAGQVIAIPALGLTIPLDSIYNGLL